jgi:hypothetical protein
MLSAFCGQGKDRTQYLSVCESKSQGNAVNGFESQLSQWVIIFVCNDQWYTCISKSCFSATGSVVIYYADIF